MTPGEFGAAATVVIALALLWGFSKVPERPRRDFDADGSE